jgi:hypothetical protein
MARNPEAGDLIPDTGAVRLTGRIAKNIRSDHLR